MSISHSLSNALSGLNASSRGAEIISSNIANAMTEGYGRRSLDLSTGMVGARGGGVRIDGILRHVDRGILGDRRLAEAELLGRTRTSDMLQRLEQSIGGIGSGTAIDDRIVALEQSLIAATGDPSNDLRLQSVVDGFNGLIRTLDAASDVVQSLRQEADADIAGMVETLNRSLGHVERLNADISRAINTGGDPSSLMDARQVAIDRIAELVPIRELDRAGGQIALITTAGQTLLDGGRVEIGFEPTPVIVPEMTVASGGLSGLTVNGDPVAGQGPAGALDGGAIGAAFALRDSSLVGAQAGLDAVARDLVERFQDPMTDPTLAAGAPGLLTDAGAAFDPADEVGLSSRLALNPIVDPAQGGALWQLRDGVGATAAGPAGSTSQLDSWRTALADPRAMAGGGAAASSAAHATAFLSRLGVDRLAAEEEHSFAAARWETLRQSELAGGVDTDYEMQMLLRVEESYAANARVIQTIESMMQTLLEI